MCTLYAQTKSQDAMRQVFRDMLEDGEELIDTAGNLASASSIFPDYSASIIRSSEGRNWTLTTARWGMPTPPVYLTAKRTDPGVTNIRNVSSPHWRRWLGIEHRCLVPFTSFSELDADPARLATTRSGLPLARIDHSPSSPGSAPNGLRSES